MNFLTQTIVFGSLTVVLVALIVLLQRGVFSKGERQAPPALAVTFTIMATGIVVLALGMFRQSDLVMSLGIEVTGAGLTAFILEWLVQPMALERQIGTEAQAIRADQSETVDALMAEIRQLRALTEEIRDQVVGGA